MPGNSMPCSPPARSHRSAAAPGLSALGLAVSALGLLSVVPAAAQSLTGATLFGADSTGGYVNTDVWNTQSGDPDYNLWFQQAGAFINGPTDAQAGLNIPLTSGVYTYDIYGAPGAVTTLDGINLFFNGSSTPSISAFGPEQTGPTPSTFAADSSATTVGPQDFTTIPGAGSLAFTQGGSTVSLTNFTWAAPSVYNIDNVGDFTTTPSGANNFVGSLTLNVTSSNGPTVPEPSSFALLGLALPALGLMVRRRVRK